MRTKTMRTKTMKLALAVVTGALLLSAGSVWSADKSVYGAITVKQGYPLAKDFDTIKSNLQLNRATELFLWALPMNAAYAIRDGYLVPERKPSSSKFASGRRIKL